MVLYFGGVAAVHVCTISAKIRVKTKPRKCYRTGILWISDNIAISIFKHCLRMCEQYE